MSNCEACGKPDSQKPMVFRGMRWCSGLHWKFVTGRRKP